MVQMCFNCLRTSLVGYLCGLAGVSCLERLGVMSSIMSYVTSYVDFCIALPVLIMIGFGSSTFGCG